jgi:hypothetical protein
LTEATPIPYDVSIPTEHSLGTIPGSYRANLDRPERDPDLEDPDIGLNILFEGPVI